MKGEVVCRRSCLSFSELGIGSCMDMASVSSLRASLLYLVAIFFCVPFYYPYTARFDLLFFCFFCFMNERRSWLSFCELSSSDGSFMDLANNLGWISNMLLNVTSLETLTSIVAFCICHNTKNDFVCLLVPACRTILRCFRLVTV